MSEQRGMVLRWQRGLVERVAEVGPSNQTRIIAVAAVMVGHARSDGARMEAGIRTLARESGQHFGRVSEAIVWLVDDGWLRFEGRIAHGGRRFTLTIPEDVQRPGGDHAGGSGQRSEESNAAMGQRPSQRSAQRSAQRSSQRSREGNESPISDLLTPISEREEVDFGAIASLGSFDHFAAHLWGKASRSQVEKYRPYLDEIAERLANDGRPPETLVVLFEKLWVQWNGGIRPSPKNIAEHLGDLLDGIELPSPDQFEDYLHEREWQKAIAAHRAGEIVIDGEEE